MEGGKVYSVALSHQRHQGQPSVSGNKTGMLAFDSRQNVLSSARHRGINARLKGGCPFVARSMRLRLKHRYTVFAQGRAGSTHVRSKHCTRAIEMNVLEMEVREERRCAIHVSAAWAPESVHRPPSASHKQHTRIQPAYSEDREPSARFNRSNVESRIVTVTGKTEGQLLALPHTHSGPVLHLEDLRGEQSASIDSSLV